MRVILDVNVWISALLWGGVPGKTLRLARNQQINIFASEFLFLELEKTLKRDKFQLRLQQRGYTLEDLMFVVKGLSNDCPTISVDAPQLRDPKDNLVLAAAVAANAEAIVTGDLDLLVLIEFNGIPILTPQDFLSRYFLD
ncbi:MAG: putative toxin-antitoxin system toxin component, PIN family [Nostoc sp. EfeVER01]|uniref:putative toxin-antitoxin system toxin component, PIN family n=1 Tax=unclassified Nostoc TaxID=2593658 RepID=UPI002AD59D39|nr:MULTISPECIES: putative toxin-antitoxin system toxin component, PIN family [unclassified Nostoc]MDZ7948853.1 putative toxin-antitoxin system toxin component, PIN family [Nostoc sp. EfeVER01]MDZ7992365.1 putative toxin-antitoxin system toxin component, PIN family [Nostoc sp. EspVER01]